MEPLARGAKRKHPVAISSSSSWNMQEPSESAVQIGAYEDLDFQSLEYLPETPSKRRAFGNDLGTVLHNSSYSNPVTPVGNPYMSEPEIFEVEGEFLEDVSRAIAKVLADSATDNMDTDEMDTAATFDDNDDAAYLPDDPYQEMRPEECFAQDLATSYAVDNAIRDFPPGSNPYAVNGVEYKHHQLHIPGTGLLQNMTEGFVGQAPAILNNIQPCNWQTPTVGRNTSNTAQEVPFQTTYDQAMYMIDARKSLPTQPIPVFTSDVATSPSTTSTNNQDDDKWQYEAGVAMTLMNEKDAEPVWEAKKILEGYPDPTDPADDPPAGLTGEQFCKYYPNHLDHHYLSHFIQKKYSGNLMAKWVNDDVKESWTQLNICKDPKNMLGKRLVYHRAQLGPDGMIWLDKAPNFLGSASIDSNPKYQQETTGEAKGRDPATWLKVRVKEREDRPIKNEKAKIKRAEAKAKETRGATSK